mmetsp:Transcript_26125/g.57853  ORF Transcript_26125/g.57853 Transcript_26125/m.57853 type:complete len:268 (-) Transcript_26125:105-908(-)
MLVTRWKTRLLDIRDVLPDTFETRRSSTTSASLAARCSILTRPPKPSRPVRRSCCSSQRTTAPGCTAASASPLRTNALGLGLADTQKRAETEEKTCLHAKEWEEAKPSPRMPQSSSRARWMQAVYAWGSAVGAVGLGSAETMLSKLSRTSAPDTPTTPNCLPSLSLYLLSLLSLLLLLVRCEGGRPPSPTCATATLCAVPNPDLVFNGNARSILPRERALTWGSSSPTRTPAAKMARAQAASAYPLSGSIPTHPAVASSPLHACSIA